MKKQTKTIVSGTKKPRKSRAKPLTENRIQIQTKKGPQSFEVVKFKCGRPPKYKTAKELETKIDEYFEKGVAIRKIKVGEEIIEIPNPTLCGLTLYLGFADKGEIYKLEQDPRFSHLIKRARTFIEKDYEEALRGQNVTGAIFWLKNAGWKDKTEIDNNIKITEYRIEFGNQELLEDGSIESGIQASV